MIDTTTALLDDHIRAIGPDLRLALTATAARNRSLGARQLLARAALGDAGTLDGLLAAARAGDHRWLRRIRRRVAPGLVAAVAQTLALQELEPTDTADALAVYELLRRSLGPRALTPANQALHAQLAYAYEGPERARQLLGSYRWLPEPTRTGLRVDLLNPFVADPRVRPVTSAAPATQPKSSPPMQQWLRAFQALLPAPGPVVDDGDDPPFDRLTAPATERIEGPHRISVVVTAYRPDQGLLTAVRSILAQTWANVEVIVVDDASPPEYDAVLTAAIGLGERVRLVKVAKNAGTYAARNTGLDAAGGEFAAFQDSDDWSHPRRLEMQVAPLLADRQLVATTSDGLAVTDQLLLTRPGVRSGRFNPSSLLIRRNAVLGTVGYFDRVRKAGDSEFIGRIQAAFGQAAVRHVDGPPLALIRLSANSLSRSEIKPHWMHPARTAYSSAYLRQHQHVVAGTAPAFRPADGSDRPFPAPGHLLGVDPEQVTEYDVVFVADWRFLESCQLTAVDEINALVAAGLRVAVLHLESYRAVYLKRQPIAAPLQDMINSGVVDRIGCHERVQAGLLLIRQVAVLQFVGGVESRVRARHTVIVADRAPVRGDGTDRRYLPADCTVAARRLFEAPPQWVPQDPGVRASLRTREAALPLAERDYPTAVATPTWVEQRTGAQPGLTVVGIDLCDAAAWPSDVADSLAVCRRLDADARVRLPDRPRAESRLVPVELPHGWLAFEPDDVSPQPFLHQLDFYLHFPPPNSAEWFSRPALEAAAMGCVVVMPERFAAFYGDAAVYCRADEIGQLITRYRADPALFAEQSRRARTVVARVHQPALLVERIMGWLPVTTATTAALPMV